MKQLLKLKVKSLIDSGVQISQLTESLVKALDLKIQNLKETLPLEGAAGIKVPYLGYVEAWLEIPGSSIGYRHSRLSSFGTSNFFKKMCVPARGYFYSFSLQLRSPLVGAVALFTLPLLHSTKFFR